MHWIKMQWYGRTIKRKLYLKKNIMYNIPWFQKKKKIDCFGSMQNFIITCQKAVKIRGVYIQFIIGVEKVGQRPVNV